MTLFRTILFGLALAFAAAPALAGDLHQRVIIDDGAAAGNDPALGTPANPLAVAPAPAASGQTLVNASSGNVANASAAASLAAVAAKTNYLSGFEVTAGGATAAACVNLTIAGLLGGTATYNFCAPAGVAIGAQPLIVSFAPPLPASAVNTAIIVTLPALGSGNTNAAVNAQGFVQ